MRYRGLDEAPPTAMRQQPFDYEAGAREQFFVYELGSEPRVRPVTATLRHTSDHAYFFVEEGVPASQSTLDRIGSDFDSLVYPAVREAFGPEPNPGVDGDPRITLLHANLFGAGGYFTKNDRYPREVHPYSNEREMLYLDASILLAPGTPYNALVAHEFQHMVHANASAREESWVDEGLAQVAAQMAGGGSDWLGLYLSAPDTSLTEWPELGGSAVHYAASELFFSYLLDHYGGRENAHRLLAEDATGITGVQAYLDRYEAQFDDVFADWLVANYLDEESGPYSQPTVSAGITAIERIDGESDGEASVSQYGARYFEVEASDGAEFSFAGDTGVSVGVPEIDGPFYWSERGDDINPRMARRIDLTDVNAATLRFDTWHEIERGWDYAYVAASTDGETWRALAGRHTTDYDPIGQAYGPGYSGGSGGWVEEEIDLSQFAGQEVLIRFEYVTDESTHGTGFAVDNIEVPETGFADGGEAASAWQMEGFVLVEGPLAQSWIVQVIDVASSEVAQIELDGDNAGFATLARRSVIVVSAVTEGTSERAEYRWQVTAPAMASAVRGAGG